MSLYENKISFLEGNPLDPSHLKRAAADNAACTVILSNQFCKDPLLEDYRNILNAFAVKQYTKAHQNREMRVCLQLLKPEHKDLYYSGLNN